MSLPDPQLSLVGEYGFPGWQDLMEEAKLGLGKELEVGGLRSPPPHPRQ